MWRKKVWQYKWWIVLVVAVIAVGKIGAALYSDKSKPVVAGQLIVVERSDILSTVSATGTIKPVNMVDVSSKITGLIKEVKVNENDQVAAGQVLIVLDDRRLKAQVAQANAKLVNSSANYERNLRLHQIGAVSAQQLDAARMDYSVAQAAYDDAVSQLDDTVIRAPIDGVVIGRPIPAGQTVSPGISTPMVLLTIADMSKMQIDTQVDESDIGKVQLGQKVIFTVDAYPGRNFSGVVTNISQRATIQQNVVYYNVTIDVIDSANLLKPTMTARVTIHVGESKNVIGIPLTAVKTSKGQQYVQVVRDGAVQPVAVEIGRTGDDKAEILSGLRDGDQVIAKPQLPDAGGSASQNSPGIFRSLMRR